MPTESNYSAPGAKPEHPDRSMTIEAQKWASGRPTLRSGIASFSGRPRLGYTYIPFAKQELIKRRSRSTPRIENRPIYDLKKGTRDAYAFLDAAKRLVPQSRRDDPDLNADPSASGRYKNGWDRVIYLYFRMPHYRIMKALVKQGWPTKDVHACHLVYNVHNYQNCVSKWNSTRYGSWYPMPDCTLDGTPYFADAPTELDMHNRGRVTKEMQAWGCAPECAVQQVDGYYAVCSLD